ncbi:MAG: hypothetical protein BWY22_00406 [Bacteroidetes bacterium ADurb.Bin217]|nr:MAG: hypothetical protein BWY22_00406 [Bacteroidetes bacterium ADurb.Bin217]
MNSNFLSIKSWAEEDRPREKLQLKGVQALSDAELLAILIATGTRSESALDIAKRIVHQSNNCLQELGRYSLHDLTKIKGIGPAKAITLLAAFELGKRRSATEVKPNNPITASIQVYKLLQPSMADLAHEEFRVLYLNRNNSIIAQKIISVGGVAGTVIDVKIIGKAALEFLASGIIVAHNHPSGNTKPSGADKDITKKIQQAAPFFDCTMLDHIIVTRNGYYSFADNGDL